MKKILLTQGQFAIVDDEDFVRVKGFRWYADCKKNGIKRNWYAGHLFWNSKCKKKEGEVSLHRFILRAKVGERVDHVNHNGLDNRKCNLRICTHSENMRNRVIGKNNTSGFKGVCLDKRNGRWYAQIKVDKRLFFLGSFVDKTDAARAYNEAAKKYHGEFAYLNKIDEKVDSSQLKLINE